MNEKRVKLVRRGVRRMLERVGPDWPEREYVRMPGGYLQLVPACRRSLYKVAKQVSRGMPRRDLGGGLA